jgi:EAL domain-containing protein (putative c-di-GMP-specific phosphodiesterase class I)
MLRAADGANVFRGFVMLVVDNRRLRAKGHSVNDLPIPVQRAAHDWAVRLGAAARSSAAAGVAAADLTPAEADRLLAFGPTIDAPGVDQFFARLRAFPVALVAQPLIPLHAGTRIRRHEVLLREASAPLGDAAPITLLREADDRGLGAVLDRRVAGALIVWLSERTRVFADEPAQFSLNLSSSSLADPNFLRFIELCLAKAGIPPALIAFEVDQSFWRKDRALFERLSTGLEAAGAGLVIDNCTLHEESADLLALPGVRLAKIDRSLTRELAASKVAQMRIAGLAQIGRVAGVHTVAKQVERADEQELLKALGVDFVQGHGTSLPIPLESLDREREASLIVDENARDPEPQALQA